MDVLSASFIKSRIICIRATLYGEVETLEVNESTGVQPTEVKEETDRLPILLLNKTPDNSSNASFGKRRPKRPTGYNDQCTLQLWMCAVSTNTQIMCRPSPVQSF
jgi:hypothetical protein